jgi:hypothetical protein
MLQKSMAEFGDLSGIIFNRRTGRLIGGHQRIKQLDPNWEITTSPHTDNVGTTALGYIETPSGRWTYREVDWDEPREKQANIAANQHGGDFDPALLGQLLESIKLDVPDLDPDLLGFTAKDLEGLLAPTPQDPKDAEPQIDKAEELNKTWQVKPGDLWQIGEHRLYCGDSTRLQDVTTVMGGGNAMLLLTDPPYGINIVKGIGTAIGGAKPFGRVLQAGGRALGGHRTHVIKGPIFKNEKGRVGGPGLVQPRLYRPIEGDDKPFDPAFLMDYAPILILFGANHYASRLPDSPCWLVWDKGVSPDSTFSACELAWVNTGNHTRRYEHRWSGMVRAGNRKDELKDRVHPTQKPVGLMMQILTDYTGDPVLDIFLGSGTTMVACENLNRKCRGIEISPEYCAVILQRMTDSFPGIKIERLS